MLQPWTLRLILNASSRRIIHDQRQVCCLPGHLCPPSSAGLAARQRPPGPLKLGCTPPLHARALARGPLAAVRLHRAVGSGTARAAVYAGGGAGDNAGANPQSHAGSQDNCHGKLLLPQLNHLHEALKRNQVSPSVSSSSQDQQPPKPSPIPSQRRLTAQLTKRPHSHVHSSH
jgi:hypothetical protein